jgi:NADPH:quinone reductase-like Zn-dependent oxidoreductase
MKAVVHDRYGKPDVLRVSNVEKPKPKDNEVLIKVKATTATLYDCWARSSTAPPGFGLMSRISSGFMQPKQPILGTELAGEIEAVGKRVSRFKPGDRVFTMLMELGAYAEYACKSEGGAIAVMPENMSFEEAAGVPQAALTALYFLRKGEIQPGHKVLIFGASGGVGSAAVQLARHMGAEITGVCSKSKMDYVRSLGAQSVIDYTREDFTTNGQIYDVIFDTVGKTPVLRAHESLVEDGKYLFATFGVPILLQILWVGWRTKKKMIMGLLEDNPEDLEFIKDIIDAGEYKAVIDKRFPMEQAAEAHRYVESGKKKGAVVMSVGPA